VVDLDPTLRKELLDIAIRQAEPQIPPNREHDHFGRKPEPNERRSRNRGYETSVGSAHPPLSPTDTVCTQRNSAKAGQSSATLT
jgi:hypothetical protein